MARYEVGPLVADTDRFEALAEGRAMTLKPKAFDAFVAFCRHPDRVLTKQELLDMVWPGLVVTESSLFKVVQEIRRALSDAGCTSVLIESVPGRGYRLAMTEVAEQSTIAAATSPETGPPAVDPRPGRRWMFALALGLIAAMLAVLAWLPLSSPPEAGGDSSAAAPTPVSREALEGLLQSAPAEALAILDAIPAEHLGSLQHRQRGLALLRLGRAQAAVSALELALALADGADERERVLDHLARALVQSGQQADAIQHLRAEETLQGGLPARLWLSLGNAYLDLGAFDDAFAAYTAAAALAKVNGDQRVLQHVLGNLGTLEHQRGNIGEARQHFEAALSLSLDALDTPVASGLQANLGNLEQQAGDYQRAARYHAQAYRAMRGHADAAQVVGVLLNFANTHMEAGNHAVANFYYERVATWATARGQHPLAWNAKLNAAISAYRQQEFTRAAQGLESLLQQHDPALTPDVEGLANALLAIVRTAQGNPLGALDLVAAAERAHARAPFALLAQHIELARARAFLAIESFAQAEAALAKALDLDELQQDRIRLEALQLHALALSALGRKDQAQARLKQASELEVRLDRAAEAFTFTLDEPLELPDA